MSEKEQIEKIAKVARGKGVDPAAQIDQVMGRELPDKEKFDSALKADTSLQAKQTGQEPNLMDEIRSLGRKVDNANKADPQALANQSKDVIAQLEEIKTRLSSPDTEIKGDYQRILRNKLEHINDNLKLALEKAGLEYVPPEAIQGAGNTPMERFLNLLTGSQEQLGSLGGQLQALADNKGTLSPASLLVVQIKVNYIQQEIEFFTSVLNKALEGTKTIMNVQV